MILGRASCHAPEAAECDVEKKTGHNEREPGKNHAEQNHQVGESCGYMSTRALLGILDKCIPGCSDVRVSRYNRIRQGSVGPGDILWGRITEEYDLGQRGRWAQMPEYRIEARQWRMWALRQGYELGADSESGDGAKRWNPEDEEESDGLVVTSSVDAL